MTAMKQSGSTRSRLIESTLGFDHDLFTNTRWFAQIVPRGSV